MSSPAVDPALAAFLKEAAYFIHAVQIIFCSFYSVAVWDWLVSLKKEYRLIWKSKWSVIKVLYLLSRYWVLFIFPYVLWCYTQDHSLETCMKIYKSPVALAMWNQLWAEGVLLVRTFAFLGNKITILVPLLLCLSCVVAYQVYVDNTQMTLLPFLDPAGGPCLPTVKYQGSPHIMLFFVFPLIFDSMVTGLTLWRAWQLRLQSGGTGSPLLKTFVSEGLWYFILISAANLANAIFYWQPKQVMSALLIPFSVVLPNILVCRMILGLRERGMRNQTTAHTSGQNSRTVRTGKPVNTQAGKTTGATAVGPDGGVVTKMEFNHELTTFNRTRVGDSESVLGGDIKTIPYELEEGPVDTGRAQHGIRVDIESHRYYEERSDAENHSLDTTSLLQRNARRVAAHVTYLAITIRGIPPTTTIATRRRAYKPLLTRLLQLSRLHYLRVRKSKLSARRAWRSRTSQRSQVGVKTLNVGSTASETFEAQHRWLKGHTHRGQFYCNLSFQFSLFTRNDALAPAVSMSQPSVRAQDWMRSHPSIRTHILGLPLEILLMVITDVIVEEDAISFQERTRVRLICKALNNFVNVTPSFWSQLSVSEPQEFWQQHLDKAGQLKLAVICDCSPDQELHASFLSFILPYAHRIYSLDCSVNFKSHDMVADVATRAAPILCDLRIFYPEAIMMPMSGLPFNEMQELETLNISNLFVYDGWWEGSVLRVVKLENVNWVYEVSTFLDFLEASDQLESFHYSLRENSFSQHDLAPQILDDTYGTIILPNLTRFHVYSIPAFHLLTILQHVSFPQSCRINATVAESFPPEQPDGHEFILPILDRLVALRPPQPGLRIMFDQEDAWIGTTEQLWDLGFYNHALNLQPREEAYQALLQQIPPNVRALTYSVNATDLPYVEDDPALLVKALSEDANHLIMFESRLNDKWLSALWTDQSRGWDGFLLPRLRSIYFVVCESSTAANFRTLIDLLQARSAAMHDKMPSLHTTITVLERFEEGEVQAALQDPILLNLGPRIERIAAGEAMLPEIFLASDEDMDSDEEEDTGSGEDGSAGMNDLGGDETLL